MSIEAKNYGSTVKLVFDGTVTVSDLMKFAVEVITRGADPEQAEVRVEMRMSPFNTLSTGCAEDWHDGYGQTWAPFKNLTLRVDIPHPGEGGQ